MTSSGTTDGFEAYDFDFFTNQILISGVFSPDAQTISISEVSCACISSTCSEYFPQKLPFAVATCDEWVQVAPLPHTCAAHSIVDVPCTVSNMDSQWVACLRPSRRLLPMPQNILCLPSDFT